MRLLKGLVILSYENNHKNSDDTFSWDGNF